MIRLNFATRQQNGIKKTGSCAINKTKKRFGEIKQTKKTVGSIDFLNSAVKSQEEGVHIPVGLRAFLCEVCLFTRVFFPKVLRLIQH